MSNDENPAVSQQVRNASEKTKEQTSQQELSPPLGSSDSNGSPVSQASPTSENVDHGNTIIEWNKKNEIPNPKYFITLSSDLKVKNLTNSSKVQDSAKSINLTFWSMSSPYTQNVPCMNSKCENGTTVGLGHICVYSEDQECKDIPREYAAIVPICSACNHSKGTQSEETDLYLLKGTLVVLLDTLVSQYEDKVEKWFTTNDWKLYTDFCNRLDKLTVMKIFRDKWTPFLLKAKLLLSYTQKNKAAKKLCFEDTKGFLENKERKEMLKQCNIHVVDNLSVYENKGIVVWKCDHGIPGLLYLLEKLPAVKDEKVHITISYNSYYEAGIKMPNKQYQSLCDKVYSSEEPHNPKQVDGFVNEWIDCSRSYASFMRMFNAEPKDYEPGIFKSQFVVLLSTKELQLRNTKTPITKKDAPNATKGSKTKPEKISRASKAPKSKKK